MATKTKKVDPSKLTYVACTPHKTVVDTLECALDILKKPSRWMKGAEGKTKTGREVESYEWRSRPWEDEDEIEREQCELERWDSDKQRYIAPPVSAAKKSLEMRGRPVQFCLIGAIAYCADPKVAAAAEKCVLTILEKEADARNEAMKKEKGDAYDKWWDTVTYDTIPGFNDDDKTTHKDVVEVLTKAVEAARKRSRKKSA